MPKIYHHNKSMPIFRSSIWWDDFVLNHFGPCDWRENFRISKAIFDHLCQNLRPLIEKANTSMRRPVSVERRIAITLWILATPSEYRSVSHLFGLARCTVCLIVHETCKAIIQKFKSVYISFPTGENLKTVYKAFVASGIYLSAQVLLMVHTYPLHHLR